MDTRKIYEMARRQYRISLRMNLLQPGAIEARDASLAMLRAIVGKLEDCRPVAWGGRSQWRGTPSKRGACARWHVNASCTRWMKSH